MLINFDKSGLSIIDCSFRGSLQYEAPVAFLKCNFKDLAVGAFTYFGQDCDMRRASIGRYCSVASRVVIAPGEHPLDRLSTHIFAFATNGAFKKNPEFQKIAFNAHPKSNAKTIIGNDVWIGEGATIMKGVTIADGAVIGSKALITKNVGAYEIVGGVPAQVIRKRFPEEIITRLLALKWWNYDISNLQEKIDITNIEATLDVLEKMKDNGELQPFKLNTYIAKPKKNGGVSLEKTLLPK